MDSFRFWALSSLRALLCKAWQSTLESSSASACGVVGVVAFSQILESFADLFRFCASFLESTFLLAAFFPSLRADLSAWQSIVSKVESTFSKEAMLCAFCALFMWIATPCWHTARDDRVFLLWACFSSRILRFLKKPASVTPCTAIAGFAVGLWELCALW